MTERYSESSSSGSSIALLLRYEIKRSSSAAISCSRTKLAAALTSDQDSLKPKEIQNALAYLAYVVQTDFPGGIVSAEDVRLRLEDFLQHDAEYGLSLSRQEAREVFRSFTNLEEGSLGMLVSQGQTNLSFFHRSLQEYLAAVHLARTPSSNQQAVIRERLADPRWREVIIGMVYLCRRDEDAGVLVDAIEKTDVDVIGGLAKEDRAIRRSRCTARCDFVHRWSRCADRPGWT